MYKKFLYKNDHHNTIKLKFDIKNEMQYRVGV